MNLKLNLRRPVSLTLVGGVILTFGAPAMADVLYNNIDSTKATLVIGVNTQGHLNSSPDVVVNAGATGIAFRFPDGSFRDATAPGCLCEGWGVSAARTSVVGSVVGRASIANGGISNLSAVPLVTTLASITSAVSLTSLPGLKVTQVYQTAANAPGALFRADVTISNETTETLNDVRYVRVMDWDIPPTEFSEHVTIKGTATTTLLERSHDNGFAVPNPLGGDSPINAATLNVDFTDDGPTDHGAFFRFNFGSLEAGKSYTFSIFYGAASTEAAALAAISAESIELFSLGQSRGGALTGTPATFIFGFRGVGGTPVVPTPEPGSLALLGLGLAGLGLARRRRG